MARTKQTQRVESRMCPPLVVSRGNRLAIDTTTIGKYADSDSGMEPDEYVSMIQIHEDILLNNLFSGSNNSSEE